jgi:hypothetical protein
MSLLLLEREKVHFGATSFQKKGRVFSNSAIVPLIPKISTSFFEDPLTVC